MVFNDVLSAPPSIFVVFFIHAGYAEAAQRKDRERRCGVAYRGPWEHVEFDLWVDGRDVLDCRI
jgi:hypothetical protein